MKITSRDDNEPEDTGDQDFGELPVDTETDEDVEYQYYKEDWVMQGLPLF